MVVLQDANFSLFREVGRVHNLTQSLQGMEFKGGVLPTPDGRHTAVLHNRMLTLTCPKIGQIIIVHNGIIENATFYVKTTIKWNSLQSETDSEAISQILAILMQERDHLVKKGKALKH